MPLRMPLGLKDLENTARKKDQLVGWRFFQVVVNGRVHAFVAQNPWQKQLSCSVETVQSHYSKSMVGQRSQLQKEMNGPTQMFDVAQPCPAHSPADLGLFSALLALFQVSHQGAPGGVFFDGVNVHEVVTRRVGENNDEA